MHRCLFGLLLLTFLVSCKRDNADSTSPCVKVDGYARLPKYAGFWFDSIGSSRMMKVYSSNGLTESLSLTYNDHPKGIASVSCNDFDMEQHLYSYKSSLYGHNITLGKEFTDYIFSDDKLWALHPAITLKCDRCYARLFSDSTLPWLRGDYCESVPGVWSGWEERLPEIIRGKTYWDVIEITRLLPGAYRSMKIDKHFGLIEFTTKDSTVWSIEL